MAFNLKGATPDTSFPANGFLFGADSQAATDPSIYSHTAYLNYILGLANTWTATQTVTPAVNTNALAVTGYSLTGANAQSLIDLAGTWNTTGTPTGIKLNITNTASNSASPLMDLQADGVSSFLVRTDSQIWIGNGATRIGSTFVNFGGASSLNWYTGGAFAAINVTLAPIAGSTPVLGLDGATAGAGLRFKEMTAPTAPTADHVILFSEDNGAGKTRLVARFASGADVVLATQA